MFNVLILFFFYSVYIFKFTFYKSYNVNSKTNYDSYGKYIYNIKNG